MTRFFRTLVVLSAFFALAQPAVALTSTQRDAHLAQMFFNIGAVIHSCPDSLTDGYGLVCANYSGSSSSLTKNWDLYIGSDTKVTITARHLLRWMSLGEEFLGYFGTPDKDRYFVSTVNLGNRTFVFAGWSFVSSDGNSAHFSSLGMSSNITNTSQPAVTQATTPVVLLTTPRPPVTQVATPASKPTANADLIVLEKYVQDSSLFYQGFVSGTTIQGAFSSSQNVFFLIAIGEKLPGSAIILKSVDEYQATLSLGTQIFIIKKR